MTIQGITASAQISAPAATLYASIADYRGGRPCILPRQFFAGLEEEQGGIGAGTRLRFQMRAMGTTRNFRCLVSEPVPRPVLAEINVEAASGTGEPDWASGSVTTFTVDPLERGRQAQVTISTELKARAGPAGWIERVLTASFLRRVFAQELQRLATVAEARSREPG